MKRIIVMLALMPLFVFAQDTLNFKEINKAKNEKGLFDYEKVYNASHYSPYNADRFELAKKLLDEINFLNTFYKGIYTKPYGTATELKNSIANLKKWFSQIDLTAYENAYSKYLEEERIKKAAAKRNDSLEVIATNKRFAQQKRSKEIEDSAFKAQNSTVLIDTNKMFVRVEDGEEFEIGKANEVNWQSALEYERNYLCNFIGFKAYWVLNIAKFLTTKGVLTYDHIKFNGKSVTYDIVPSVTPNYTYGKAKLVANYNDDERVTSLNITGNLNTLIYFFVRYYPTTLNVNNPKIGVSYTKHLLNEDMILTVHSLTNGTIKIKKR